MYLLVSLAPRLSTPPTMAAIGPDEAVSIEAVGGPQATTYGELTSIGFRQLFGDLGESDKFVDLGSGTGKLVMQAVRELGVDSAAGVELSPTRHGLALAQRAACEPRVARRTTFLCGDAAGDEAARMLETATAVWLSNLCFDERLNRRIVARLEASPTVQRIWALRLLPEVPRGFDIESARPAECSSRQASQTGLLPMPGHPCVSYIRTSFLGRTPRGSSSV